MTERGGVRDRIESYLQLDAAPRAEAFAEFVQTLGMLARESPDVAREYASRAVSVDLDYSSLRRLRKFVLPSGATSNALRIAVLGGPTSTQLVELLEVMLAGAGIPAVIHQGDYGLFRQEILGPSASLDDFRPQIVFLATSGRDVTRAPSASATRDELRALVEAELADWQALWRICSDRWGATTIQNTFDIAPGGAFGHYALRVPGARARFLDELNRACAEHAPANVVLHDLGSLVTELGAKEWFDPRFYFEAKMPCGPECLVPYAHSVMSLVRAIAGKSKKVLVLDLDNTLWGGTVGDLGAGGVQLGQGSGEGEAFLAFQQYAKELHERGIVLAVCSKNDDARAREPFATRSDMALKLSDIACFIANWRDKAENLREIAANLGLGIDSLVFVDDNPAERAIVRRLAPLVAVPDMPEDPAGYIRALARHRFFETTSFTDEDVKRARFYAQNSERKAMASTAGDLDAFLTSLEMVAFVGPVTEMNVQRVTQLANKSNQFNLTTRRYTVAAVEALAKDPAYRTITVTLKDRLGDNGLISVLFARKLDDRLDIETWLMSCRVLQRGVEQLALNLVVDAARQMGCRHVTGTFIPTEKNEMVREHYSRLGFEQVGADGGTTYWRYAIPAEHSPIATRIRTEMEK